MKDYKPMLAKTVETPFSSKDWIFEVKWDGIRAISYVAEDLSIKSRNQKELKSFFPEFDELKQLTSNTVLDGEIIIIRNGQVDFQAVLKRIQATTSQEINYLNLKQPALYILFDILEKDGKPVTNKPLLERKQLLVDTVKEGKNVIISDFIENSGELYYQAILEKGLEGIIAKKKDSIYIQGTRTNNWYKIKKIRECDCVIFGYTKGTGIRQNTFGALILGLYQEDHPVFVGKVGTGFTNKKLEQLSKEFENLKVNQKTLKTVDIQDDVTWIKPVLVCKVKYQTVTSDGKLRMPRFIELRKDKAPLDCKIEQIYPVKLLEYVQKRDFTKTPEPTGSKKVGKNPIFVVQEHDARRLHYDLRLEKDDVLKSWAVPKEIPLSGGIKRLAVKTEDHPLDYANFEGTIPDGQYGAGTVKIWDSGHFSIKNWESDKIEVTFDGKRLEGKYVLVRLKKSGLKNWLLFKVGT
jgi:DNA ligase D-like protein (predicted ligase)/DNA ligase D-like protein (predicted 3'-phosphoesterase)